MAMESRRQASVPRSTRRSTSPEQSLDDVATYEAFPFPLTVRRRSLVRDIQRSGTPMSDTRPLAALRRHASRKVLGCVFVIAMSLILGWAGRRALAQAPGPCAPPNSNPIVCENAKTGNPASEWDIFGSGDASIQGFATEISVDKGQIVRFKVSTPASSYRLDIYRLGYYDGMGARRVATVNPSASLPQSQPSCLSDAQTGLIDCGNWAVSASWTVPADAVSGIYVAKATRNDTGGASHIVFVVRDDAGQSDLLFQTSDTTWAAYNSYGGNSFYSGLPAGRAYKASYNRPFNNRDNGGGPSQGWVFNSEYPTVRWLEANGYFVSYSTGVDTDRRGAELLKHKAFLSVGHDEYWSAAQRGNVEAARNAGVHLAFLSANEVFWKTRWEGSIDASRTAYRTLVCYKETTANGKIDPATNVWTGAWRDPRFSPPADGGRPENALTGTLFMVNGIRNDGISVPAAEGRLRFWRNTSVALLPSGGVADLPTGTLGYEWDIDVDNGFRPAGLMRMSSTTLDVSPQYLLDYGSTYGQGVATHSLTLYRHSSGALVFGAGTVQWPWGLDSNHDNGTVPTDVRMQQATVNLLADMGVQPITLQQGLFLATASNDTLPPTSTITAPNNDSTLIANAPVVITGTAFDSIGVVGGVEISTDSGVTWHPMLGRENWSYTWTPQQTGVVNILTRAVDDSGNLQTPAGISVTVAPDQTPPVISAVQLASSVSTWATIGWTTNEAADSQVEYGTTTAYGTVTTRDPTLVPNHAVSISPLTPNTLYHFRVLSRDGAGNLAVSADYAFTSPASDASSVVTFDDLAGQDKPLDGQYPSGLIDWGTGTWFHSGAWGGFTTKNISFANSAVVNGDVQFAFPIRVLRIDVFNGGSSSTTITLSCPGHAPVQAVVAAGQLRTIPTGLTEACSSFTIGSTNGWATNFDNLVFDTPPDNTPPAISGIQLSGIDTTHGTVSWTTSEGSDAQVEYGTTTAYGLLSPRATVFTVAHSISLSGLSPATTYHFRVRSRDVAGNLGVSSDGLFQTDAPDTTAPTFSAMHAILVTGTSGQITWATSEPADTQLEYGPTTAYGSQSALTATFAVNHGVPLAGLSPGATYHYRVYGRDAAGNLGVSADATFATPLNGGCPCSLWPLTSTPAVASQADTAALELGMRFRADRVGYITGVRFYKGPTNTGTHVGNLWTDAGVQLATATFTSETATGWQEVAFSTPISVTANTTYVASYFASNGGYAQNSNYFNAALDVPPLHAPATTSTPNGVYKYSGVSTFPNLTFAGSNYWVDVVFVPAPDTTAPVISSIQVSTTLSSATVNWHTNEPADSAVEYGVTATYASATTIDPSLVVDHTVQISGLASGTTYHYRIRTRDQSGNLAVSADLLLTTAAPDTTPPSFSAFQTTLVTGSSAQIGWSTSEPADAQLEYGLTTSYGTLTPLAPALTLSHSVALSGLTPGTTYHYRVRGRDATGNLGLSADVTLTTPTPGSCPCSLWPLTATPAVASNADSSSVELGVRVRADRDGWITGIRFYKGPQNTGTHVGHFWTDTGQLLATATFTNESGSGWQELAFAAPLAVTANTMYLASYYAPNGGYSINLGYFNAPLDVASLHAPATTTAANGLYQYGAGGFPSSTYGAANYWVDVVFMPAPDTTPPSITLAQAATTLNAATVTWHTNEPANSTVEYGSTTAYGTTTPLDSALVLDHTVQINGLAAGMTYHYRIRTQDQAGNLALSPGLTMTTTPPDTAPPSFSGMQATLVTGTSAQITWTTSEAADSQLEYGLTTSYGTQTPLVTTLTTSHSLSLSGLSAGTTYRYRVRGRDAAGNQGMSGDVTFTTPGPGTCPCSFWSLSTTPAVPSNADSSAVELGGRFRSDQNGYITGLRFYKGPQNTGVHTAHLWTDTGQLLATATFTSESATGWQEAAFSTPVAITANTTYVASYYAPNGGYSINSGYFNSALDVAPLHAPATATAANGLYRYGPAGFPNSTYAAGNYWVDVVFVIQ